MIIDFETAMDAINDDPWSICNISDESAKIYEKYLVDDSSTFLNPNWEINKKNTDIPEDWFQPGFVWAIAQSWCPEDYDPDEIAKDNIIKFFKLLDEEWQSMPTFICQVARWNPKLLAHINQDLLQNYEMVAALVKSNDDCLDYLEDRIKNEVFKYQKSPIKYLKTQADKNHSWACLSLAKFYAEGKIWNNENKLFLIYFNKARDLGNEIAKEWQTQMYEHLSSIDIIIEISKSKESSKKKISKLEKLYDQGEILERHYLLCKNKILSETGDQMAIDWLENINSQNNEGEDPF